MKAHEDTVPPELTKVRIGPTVATRETGDIPCFT